MAQLKISCLCGAAKQSLTAAPDAAQRGLSICHCSTCRHSTGLLCTSYYPLAPTATGATPALDGLRRYDQSPRTMRYFCATCGCHIFRSRAQTTAEGGPQQPPPQVEWEVATGVIVSERAGDGSAATDWPRYRRHVNVADTGDGGLSVWVREVDGVAVEVVATPPPEGGSDAVEVVSSDGGLEAAGAPTQQQHHHHHRPGVEEGGEADDDVLDGACACGNVRFHVTRPDGSSRLPRSGLPDLMLPYHLDSPERANPGDAKWWLRPSAGQPRSPPCVNSSSDPVSDLPTRYLAGTCACRSCRLVSGFEVQTWAFVPRSNIVFHVGGIRPASPSVPGEHLATTAIKATASLMPLDFATLPAGILTPYVSSPGVTREFCGGCGATVFWHDAWWRPELIDVSVGLLHASSSSSAPSSPPGGARAEDWLDWWRGRVSFAEDAGLGREGAAGARAAGLIRALGEGLAAAA